MADGFSMTGYTFKSVSQKLAFLDSFMPADKIDSSILSREFLDENELLIGVYLNTFDDFIAFTSKRLHWVSDSIHHDVAYETVNGVKLPDDESDRLLVLTLDAGELNLPILNETDEYPDLHEIFEILSSIAYWPFKEDVSEGIAAVSSREDLIDYLVGAYSGGNPQQVLALRRGFPDLRQLQKFQISPHLLNNPETWRLLASFLSLAPQFRDDVVP